MSRRRVVQTGLVVAGGLTASGLWSASPAAADTAAAVDSGADRLVMLGVDGGPTVNVGHAKPALALVAGGSVYLVDCGLDTARQLVASGLGFANLENVFLTHHHVDHTSGLPDLVLHGWTYARSALGGLTLWGPPGVKQKLTGLTAMFGQDVRLYEAAGGFADYPTLRAHDVKVPGSSAIVRVMEDDNVVVDATRVFHGPEVKDAYAYRFTVKASGKVVVFSGDTAAPDANLIRLAHDCDVLVHEVMDSSLIDRITASLPEAQAEELRTHMLQAHSDVSDLPRVAKAAGARRLVLCHYTPIPQAPAAFSAKAQTAADAIGYRGSIIAPSDLDVIAL
ncbi:MBL fold metallo-hydrolase [Streptomyces sp. NPDC003247]|uniref:MBL fold metallo-hydrolase n=1 Tax=Streptomyces sp. NPDC003247 TaxID=3364677 RepID=UPI00368E0F8A